MAEGFGLGAEAAIARLEERVMNLKEEIRKVDETVDKFDTHINKFVEGIDKLVDQVQIMKLRFTEERIRGIDAGIENLRGRVQKLELVPERAVFLGKLIRWGGSAIVGASAAYGALKVLNIV